MPRVTIARKLMLLAGVPVLGALILSGLLVSRARDDLRRSAALGSVESLAELTQHVSTLTYRLQSERALMALHLGTRTPRTDMDVVRNVAPGDLAMRAGETDAAAQALRSFAATRDLSRLPRRLARGLGSALDELGELPDLRRKLAEGAASPQAMMSVYGNVDKSLIRAAGALTELTDDGELLRPMSSLVALLELQERTSAEHALLSYVFGAGDFPPGTYRDWVTLQTEQNAFDEVLRNNAAASQVAAYESAMASDRVTLSGSLRKRAMSVTDGDYNIDAWEWYGAAGAKIEAMRRLQEQINVEVRQRALTKLAQTKRAFATSMSLGLAALVGSMALAILIGRGVARSVHLLKDAAQRVGQGATDVRVVLRTKDELETLGNAFNDMTAEIARAREALREQARMARDLEIAASIQAALLPPAVEHPELEFAGRMRPADEVGGDFYDVLVDPRSRALWVTIGDVSGHGVPAGLVMLITQSAFAAYFRANPLARPDEVIRGVNDLLKEQIGMRLHDDKYVTGLLMTYGGKGRFVFAGAHQWPIIWRAAKRCSELVEAPGPWMGLHADLADIPVSSVNLGLHDVMCLYSDGLIEARNEHGELFDVERLQRAIEEAMDGDGLGATADLILDRIAAYSPRREDDWTLLLVRRAA